MSATSFFLRCIVAVTISLINGISPCSAAYEVIDHYLVAVDQPYEIPPVSFCNLIQVLYTLCTPCCPPADIPPQIFLDRECSICFDLLATKQISLLGCGHVFHGPCLDETLRRWTQCPLCRAPIIKIFKGMSYDAIKKLVKKKP